MTYTEWEPEEGDIVLVDTVRASWAASTLAIGEGIREKDGRPITFAGDWHMMRALACAIRDDGPQLARVPVYAVLTVEPRPAA